ncbi:Ubiquitin-like modifier-activating enzyme ATG7 [Armadillidium nasatum]|uniref:Ubiquitin-like modifier-activating enzyme ATG7 n=1 Tax=Armadillidium nasatum TaxID=96803 RepID=A0A5N5ST75_9CRUS|nr:Ubiquitin-like modifier-activating enzyme ATG7 [Armadillidium nasatum]
MYCSCSQTREKVDGCLTLMGAAYKKIVLTAALGFDSFLVMRHGSHPLYEGENLGCYFCNDVVAPGDSVSDRTLDQQCTVTRPGISFMASGHITEMLIDILQYPQRSKSEEEVPSVSHSVRYYLGRMNQLITSTPAFNNCSACSPLVLEKYRENGTDFLMNVFNSPSFLEEVSGLKKLHQESQMVDLSDFSEQSSNLISFFNLEILAISRIFSWFNDSFLFSCNVKPIWNQN